MSPRQSRSCVIVVENLPVPFDRRVWQEAQALNRAGWRVSVICPATENFPAKFEVIDDIAVYRHSLPLEARGVAPHFLEYAAALFHEFRLLLKVHRERGFSIIQACNPPDFIFLAAAPFKLLGKRFIFDQHDVGPELFVAKYGNKGVLYRALLFFERRSYAMADFVITANATFKDIAVRRGGKSPEAVEVVYGAPDRKAHPSRRARAGTAGDAQIHSRLSRRDRRAGRRQSSRARGRRTRPRQGVLRLSRGRRRRRAGARFSARTRESARPCRFLRLHRVSRAASGCSPISAPLTSA